MEKNEIFNFLNNNTTAIISTTDGEKPYVRTVWTVKSDKNGILFHTGSHKDLYKQLIKNQNVEFCFLNNDKSIQIRVSGKAKPVDDINIKDEIISQRDFLKDIKERQGSYDFLSVFLVKKCVAVVWTMETNMQEKQYINLFE